MTRHERVSAIIRRLGGRNAVRESLGISQYSTVQSWEARGFIPAVWFMSLLDMAKGIGVELTLEELAIIADQTRVERPSGRAA